MRKLLIFCLLLFVLATDAQITGFGPFQINRSSFSIVDSIARSGGVRIQKATSRWAAPYSVISAQKLTTIFILVPDSIKRERTTSDRTYWVPNVKSVYINYLEVQGQALSNVYLLFYKDILISVEGDCARGLEQWFTAKHGKPKVSHSTSNERCKDSYVIEEAEWSEWQTGSKYISLKMLYHIFYDSECDKEQSWTFYLKNLQIVDDIIAAEIFGK